MVRRRTAPAPGVVAVLVMALLAGCTVPGAARQTTPGTVAARVVDGSGGARLVLVPIYFGDRGPYDFALDTGAARSLVDARVVSQLGLPTSGREVAVTGVTGTSEAARVVVSSWRVGTVQLPRATILSLSLPQGSGPRLSGLLGSDMLSRFRAVKVDYEAESVTLS